MDLTGFELRSPELQQLMTEDPPVAQLDQLGENRARSVIGELGQPGLSRRDIDRGAREHQLADLCRKARRINERHPPALAQSDQVDCATEFVNKHVKSSK